MDSKGGRFTLDISGTIYSGRAAAKIMPSTVSVTTAANRDGTAYRTVAPKLAGLDLSFDRGVGLKWDAAMILQSVKATFIETDANIMHLFTDAGWDGDPTIDSDTGEVTGLKLMSSQYKSTNAT